MFAKELLIKNQEYNGEIVDGFYLFKDVSLMELNFVCF